VRQVRVQDEATVRFSEQDVQRAFVVVHLFTALDCIYRIVYIENAPDSRPGKGDLQDIVQWQYA